LNQKEYKEHKETQKALRARIRNWENLTAKNAKDAKKNPDVGARFIAPFAAYLRELRVFVVRVFIGLHGAESA